MAYTFPIIFFLRERRVKCDETKPACKNCIQRKGNCGGYATAKIWTAHEDNVLQDMRGKGEAFRTIDRALGSTWGINVLRARYAELNPDSVRRRLRKEWTPRHDNIVVAGRDAKASWSTIKSRLDGRWGITAIVRRYKKLKGKSDEVETTWSAEEIAILKTILAGKKRNETTAEAIRQALQTAGYVRSCASIMAYWREEEPVRDPTRTWQYHDTVQALALRTAKKSWREIGEAMSWREETINLHCQKYKNMDDNELSGEISRLQEEQKAEESKLQSYNNNDHQLRIRRRRPARPDRRQRR